VKRWKEKVGGRKEGREVANQRAILAVVDDLMMGVRIEEAAKTLGAEVETAGSLGEGAERLRSRAVDVVVVDLAMDGLDLEATVSLGLAAGARVVGFYPHVDAALRQAAKRAGIERVYPRSRFLRDLPLILRESLEG